MGNDKLMIERIYNAPVEKVWNALTDKEQMKKWYFPQMDAFEPEPGFQTQFNVNNEGKDYLHIWKVGEAVPLKKISYEWKYGSYPGNSLVSFELFPGGKDTKIVLTHAGLDTFKPEDHPELSKENFEKGWTMFIGARLKDFVERSV